MKKRSKKKLVAFVLVIICILSLCIIINAPTSENSVSEESNVIVEESNTISNDSSNSSNAKSRQYYKVINSFDSDYTSSMDASSDYNDEAIYENYEPGSRVSVRGVEY